MSQNEMNIFRKFIQREEAISCKNILDSIAIQSEIKLIENQLGGVFLGDQLNSKFALYVFPDDFIKAEYYLNEQAENLINSSEEDLNYYLYSYSDKELIKIQTSAHEWSEYDIILSKIILTQRGVILDLDLIKKQRLENLEKIAQPEIMSISWVIVGYLFAVLGGFLGLLIGYFYWTSKKTLTNGTKVYSYDENSRKQAKIMFIISVIIFPIFILIKIWNNILLYI